MEDNRRRQPSDTPKSGRSKKRMKGSGSMSEQPTVALEGEEEIMRVDLLGFNGKCSECGKEFLSERALSGHMRCHPERNWRGIFPPPMTARMTNHTAEGVTTEEEIADSLVLLSTVEVSAKKNEDRDVNVHAGTGAGADADAVTPTTPVTVAEVQDEGAVAGSVFECSGCKRIFDSHQALGGHRASHKNIQGCYATEKKDPDVTPAPVIAPPPQLRPEPTRRDAVVSTGGTRNHHERRSAMQPPPMQTERHSSRRDHVTPAIGIPGKEYKCCVCSKTFSTGQALGGHMRWHLERNQLLGLAVAAAASGSVAAATTFSSLSSSSSHLQHHMRLTNLGRGTGDLHPFPPPPPPRSNVIRGWSTQLGSATGVRGQHPMISYHPFQFGSPSTDQQQQHRHYSNRVFGLGQQIRRASGLGEHQLYGTPLGSSSSSGNINLQQPPQWLQQGWICGSSSTIQRPVGGAQFPGFTNPRWFNLQGGGEDINHGLNLNLSLNLNSSTASGHENPRSATTADRNPNNTTDNNVRVTDHNEGGDDTELRLGIGAPTTTIDTGATTTTTAQEQEEEGHGSSPSSSSSEIDLDLKL